MIIMIVIVIIVMIQITVIVAAMIIGALPRPHAGRAGRLPRRARLRGLAHAGGLVNTYIYTYAYIHIYICIYIYIYV